jgi:hypothetical protein
VRRAGKARWCEHEICNCKQCPNGGEQHEVDAVRRPVPSPWAIVRIDNYRIISQSITRWKKLHTVRCQAQHNDGKYDLHGTKAENDSWSHHRVCRRRYLMQGLARCRTEREGCVRGTLLPVPLLFEGCEAGELKQRSPADPICSLL